MSSSSVNKLRIKSSDFLDHLTDISMLSKLFNYYTAAGSTLYFFNFFNTVFSNLDKDYKACALPVEI